MSDRRDAAGEKVLAEGKYLRLVNRGGWEFVTRRDVTGIVGIVAVTDEGRMILVEQHRPAVGVRVIELPAGLAGDSAGTRGEDLAAAARRELLEETGYEAAHMEYLCEGTASAGLRDEVIALYRATGLRKVGDGGGDESEDIVVHEIPVAEAAGWVAARAKGGLGIDLKVWAGLYFATAGR
jgi:ADP-ribose pyrophosphatase